MEQAENIHNPLYPPYLKGDFEEGESTYLKGDKARISMLRFLS
jgi:hypothetical protein